MSYWYFLWALTAAWVAFELWLIVRDRAQGKGTREKDRGSLYFNFLSIAVGMTAAGEISGKGLLLPWRWTAAGFWIGFAIMLLGLSFRIWSILVLGKSFRTTVETHENQAVVSSGPYRILRHPSYSGLVVMCLGYGLAVQNWLSLFIVVALPLAALLYRIHVEEAVLVAALGSPYREYQKRTKKLVPWIW